MVDGLCDLSLLLYETTPENKDNINKRRQEAINRFDPSIIDYFNRLSKENPDCDFLLHRTYFEKGSFDMDNIMSEGLAVNGGNLDDTTTHCGSQVDDLLCQTSSSPAFKGYSTAIIALVPRNGTHYMPGKTIPVLYETDSAVSSNITTAATSSKTEKGYKLDPKYIVGCITDINDCNCPINNFTSSEDYLTSKNLKLFTPSNSLRRYNKFTSEEATKKLNDEYGMNIPWSKQNLLTCPFSDDELRSIYPKGIVNEKNEIISVSDEQKKFENTSLSRKDKDKSSIFKIIANVSRSSYEKAKEFLSNILNKNRGDIDRDY